MAEDDLKPTRVQRKGSGDDERVFLISPSGVPGSVPRADVPKALAQGYRLETPESIAGRQTEQEYGGTGQQILTGLEGAARTITFGGSDVALDALDPEGVRARKQVNPGMALTGEIGGALLPGGAAKLATRAGGLASGAAAGSRAVRGLAEGGLLARTAARAAPLMARGAAEGAVFGAGQGVSQVALADDGLTGEQAAVIFGSNVLFGAGIGAGAGLGGSLLRDAAVASKKLAGRAAARMAQKAPGAADDAALQTFDDVAQMTDRKALRGAKDAELGVLEQGRVAERKALAGDIVTFRNDAYSSGFWTGAQKASKPAPSGLVDAAGRPMIDDLAAPTVTREVRQALAVSKRADTQLRRLADNPAALERNPWKALDALERQETALLALADDAATMAGTKGEAIKSVLQRNQALQARIEALKAPATSARLSAIEARLDDLAAPAERKGIAQQAGEGAAFSAVSGGLAGVGVPYPIAAMVGAKAAGFVGDALTGKLSQLGAKVGRGVTDHAARLQSALDGALKVGGKVGRAAPVLASKTLASLSYAGPESKAGRVRQYAKTSNALLSAFRDRADDLRAQTTPGPDGKPKMRPEALQALHRRLAGLWSVAPQLADAAEVTAQRRLEFLASKLPPRTEMDSAYGPDRWSPSDLDMRQFARYAAAAEDPAGVIERVADGKVTPEDAEALRVVYPEMFAAVQQNLLGQLTELQETLPYDRRLQLSILFDVPVDPSMRPETVSALQQWYEVEPGTEGGTQGPAPNAKFGSVKRSAPEPTSAQRMSNT